MKRWKVLAAGIAAGFIATDFIPTVAAAAETPAASILAVETKEGLLDIIDPASLKVVAKVPVGGDPHEVTASADGRTAYVSNYQGPDGLYHRIARVDLVAQKQLPPIDLGVLAGAHGLYFAGGKLYFTVEGNRAIGRYDPATEKVDWVMGTGQDGTHLIWVSKSLDKIIASNRISSSFSIFENIDQPANGQSAGKKEWALTTVPTDPGTEGFDFTPDGKQLWVANREAGTITVIDPAAKKVQATIQTPSKNLILSRFSHDGKYALLTSVGVGPNLPNLVVFDVANRKEIKRLDIGIGTGAVLLDPNGTRAFISPYGGKKLIIFDFKTLSVTGEIPNVSEPNGLAWVERK